MRRLIVSMCKYGSVLLCDGHRSYPALCRIRPEFEFVQSIGFQEGVKARSCIEGLWGVLKSIQRSVYRSKYLPAERVDEYLAELVWRWENNRNEKQCRDSLLDLMKRDS